jgi:hypothetical protein
MSRSYVSSLPRFHRLRNLVTRQNTICPVCAQPVEMRAGRQGFKVHDLPWQVKSTDRRCWASGKHPTEIAQLYRTFASTSDYYDAPARFSSMSSVELVDNADSLSLLAWSEVNEEITARVLVHLSNDDLLRFLDEALTIAERVGIDGLAELKERHR